MSVRSDGAAGPTGEAARWIARLDLRPHPEGGYYRETYRAAESIAATALPARYGGARAFATAIYFLLPSGEISALHRLRSDELWYFHAGSALTLVTLDADGTLERVTLGARVDAGEQLQATVRAALLARFPRHTAIVTRLTRSA